MRRRNSNNNMATSKPAMNNNNNNNNNENHDHDNNDSDPEEGILAAHPNEEAFRGVASNMIPIDFHSRILQELLQGKVWWVHGLTIYSAALLTYSMTNVAPTNVQIAIMTVITLVGASPFCKTHLLPASIGTFVGGHSLFVDNPSLGKQYGWLLVLSTAVTIVWSFLVSRYRILDGYAGRLGTTTFLAMNLAAFCFLAPLGVIPWDLYVYGFLHWTHAGEAEDSSSMKIGMAWTWAEEAEGAIGYVAAVVWLSVIAGSTRIYHHKYSQTKSPPPEPLNNVLIPVLWALLSMMMVNAIHYKLASGLYNGFAVGSYVAMASLQRIPSITKFALVGATAALLGLASTPIFFGFAGKSGFTAMLGHIAYDALETTYTQFLARRQLERDQQEQQQQYQEQLQRQQLQQEQLQQQNREQEQFLPPTTPPQKRKPIHKEVFYTKQQRRQKQRLQHLHEQHQQPPPPPQPQNQQLHHRAWSALPQEGDSAWQHPMNESFDDSSS